eukprot:SAG25_NODE_177_length_12713_cov_474.755272_5_plen_158_part_00
MKPFTYSCSPRIYIRHYTMCHPTKTLHVLGGHQLGHVDFKVSGRAERRILCFRILVSRDQERFGRYCLYVFGHWLQEIITNKFFLILKMFLDTGHQYLFCYLRAANCKILCFFGVQNDVHLQIQHWPRDILKIPNFLSPLILNNDSPIWVPLITQFR